MQVCPSCEAAVPEQDRVCSRCGARLVPSAAPPTPPPEDVPGALPSANPPEAPAAPPPDPMPSGSAGAERVDDAPSGTTSRLGAAEGRPLVAAWEMSAPSGHFCRVCVVNRSGRDLGHVAARAGEHAVRFHGTLHDRELWELDVPADAAAFTVRGFAAGAEPRWYGAAWSLRDVAAGKPVVEVAGAGSMGDVFIDLDQWAGGPVFKAKDAGDAGRVMVRVRHSKHRRFRSLPCVREADLAGVPPWLGAGRASRWILFAGPELSVGRSSRAGWTVYTRAEDGERALAANAFGQPVAVERDRWNDDGIYLPISRCHLTLRWQGRTLELCDGRPGRMSKLGLFRQNGCRVDKGWNTLPLPSLLWLGPPDDPFSLLVECARFELPGRGACVALRCANQDHGEVVLWQRPADARFDFETAGGALVPVWLAEARGLCVERREPVWQAIAAGCDLALSLHTGATVDAGATRIVARHVTADRAVLETTTG